MQDHAMEDSAVEDPVPETATSKAKDNECTSNVSADKQSLVQKSGDTIEISDLYEHAGIDQQPKEQPEDNEAQVQVFFEENPNILSTKTNSAATVPGPDSQYNKVIKESFPVPNLHETQTALLREKIGRYFKSDSTDVLRVFSDIEESHSASHVHRCMMLDPQDFQNLTSNEILAEFKMKVCRHMTTFNFAIHQPVKRKKIINKSKDSGDIDLHLGAEPSVDENESEEVDIEIDSDKAQHCFVHANWQAVKKLHVTTLSKEEIAKFPETLKKELDMKPEAFHKFIQKVESVQATAYLVDFILDPKYLVGEFFEINVPEFAKRFVNQLNSGNIKILLMGLHKTVRQLETIMHIFNYHRFNKLKSGVFPSDPLRKFHLNAGRMVFREDQLITNHKDNDTHGYYVHYAYHGLDEALTVAAVNLVQEREAKKSQRFAYEDVEHEIPLVRVHNGGERTYMTWLPLPDDEESDLLIKEGDRLVAVFDDLSEPNFKENGWAVQVIAPISYGPLNMIPAIITRRIKEHEETNRETQKKVTTRDFDKVVLKVVDLKGSAPELSQSVRRAPVNTCRLQIQDSDKLFKQNFSAIDSIANSPKGDLDTPWRKAMRVILSGVGFKDLAEHNGIAHIMEEFPDFLKQQEFPINEGQRKAFELMTKALAGVCIINGPPGTGKTHIHKQLIGMNMRLKKHYVSVLATNTNEGVNKLVMEYKVIMDEGKKKGSIPKARYLVRLHSTTTETTIQNSFAMNCRPKTRVSVEYPIEEAGEELIDELFEIAVLLGEVVHQNQKTTYAGIRDQRVVHIEDSVAYVMLKKSGIIPDEHLSEQGSKWDRFKAMYFTLASGESFTKADKEEFAKLSQSLFDAVIRGASVVIATNTGLCTTKALRALSPCAKILVFDEAMAMKEQDMLPIAATAFKQLDLMILCGDFYQVGPRPDCEDPEKVTFFKQGAISLPSRIATCGFSVAYLTEQNRMNAEIRQIVSTISYGDTLTDAPGVALDRRTASQRARAAVSTLYKKMTGNPSRNKSSVMIWDFSGKANRVDLSPTGSRHCDLFIIFLMNNIEAIITFYLFAKATTFAIITPYAEERNRLITAKAKMELLHPHLAEPLSRVFIGTVDAFRGHEFDVVFTTLPVTSTGGHTNHKRRQAVQLSRARHMMVILLSSERVRTARNVSNIQKLLHVPGKVTAKLRFDNLPYCMRTESFNAEPPAEAALITETSPTTKAYPTADPQARASRERSDLVRMSRKTSIKTK